MRHIAGVAAAAATTKSVGAVSLAVFPIFFCPYHTNICIPKYENRVSYYATDLITSVKNFYGTHRRCCSSSSNNEIGGTFGQV